jgi:hypothetical protein
MLFQVFYRLILVSLSRSSRISSSVTANWVGEFPTVFLLWIGGSVLLVYRVWFFFLKNLKKYWKNINWKNRMINRKYRLVFSLFSPNFENWMRNNLSGSVPNFFGDWPNLEYLNLSDNNFEGPSSSKRCGIFLFSPRNGLRSPNAPLPCISILASLVFWGGTERDEWILPE